MRPRIAIFAFGMIGLLLVVFIGSRLVSQAAPVEADAGPALPAAAVVDQSSDATTETAVFAGGCFWGVQGVYQHIDGVTEAISGYAGGKANTADYQTVGTGTTGHAEVVEVTYDPRKVSYAELLQVFFEVAHDPTELNRQGPDVGTQYRSTIFPTSDEQARVAKAYIAQLDKANVFDAPIATTIESGQKFYPAEAYHQDYLTLHPDEGYIVVNDLPKVEHLERAFPSLWRDEPALVNASG